MKPEPEARCWKPHLCTPHTHTHTFSKQQHINMHAPAKTLKMVHVTLSKADREPSSVAVPSHPIVEPD